MVKWAGLALMALGGVGVAFAQTAGDPGQACADIRKLSLGHVEIAQATVVEAGKLDLGQQKPDPILKELPALCRVVAVSRPTADSNIKIEVWLPMAGWNGKFMGQGNGGFAGSISYGGLEVFLKRGFATGGTDTGHTGEATDSAWAVGHPEKVVDFGYRALHEMTVLSKAAVEAFYAKPAAPNYFTSCSNGGREALMEAQRFPADYDGIIAGAPGYNWTSLLSRGAQLSKELQAGPESSIPASKIPAINKAVLKACGKGEPGAFLGDPLQCHFSPETLVCKGPETDNCLTRAQAKSVMAIYASARTRDGKLVYHGLLPGGELGDSAWTGWITGKGETKSAISMFAQGFFADLVYPGTNWDLKKFDLDRDMKAAEEKTGQVLNAVDPDLKAFGARGGKLILYNGWNDPPISALSTLDYYNSVVQTVGQAQAASFVRLFLVPGMLHCAGGPGLSDFGQFAPDDDPALDDATHNMTTALETWVEKGTAPEQVIARSVPVGEGAGKQANLSQPICAYPKAAAYKGSGDKADAANYACVAK